MKVYEESHDESVPADIYRNFAAQRTEVYKDLKISPMPGAEELFRSLKERNILTVLNTDRV